MGDDAYHLHPQSLQFQLFFLEGAILRHEAPGTFRGITQRHSDPIMSGMAKNLATHEIGKVGSILFEYFGTDNTVVLLNDHGGMTSIWTPWQTPKYLPRSKLQATWITINTTLLDTATCALKRDIAYTFSVKWDLKIQNGG